MSDGTRYPTDPPRGDADVGDRPVVAGGRNDHELYQLLSDEEFADHAFEVLAVALVGYAYRVLSGWMASGAVYRRCTMLGWPVWPTDAERTFLYTQADEVNEIINETLGEALVQLRRHAASGENKWDPNGGLSLNSYFVGACVQRFPNVYRRWSREFQRRLPTESYSDDDRAVVQLTAADDVEQEIVSATRTREMLTTMPANVREIVELRLNGHGYAEIARRTGATSARAVEGVLQRYRAQQRADGPRWNGQAR
jgi:DNA-directed RNA polymerase specialized sigma24 family protein